MFLFGGQVYYGVGWRKKFKSPTDFCFAIKHPRLQQPKSSKYIKFLCAEDQASLDRWVMGIRLAKVRSKLTFHENHRNSRNQMFNFYNITENHWIWLWDSSVQLLISLRFIIIYHWPLLSFFSVHPCKCLGNSLNRPQPLPYTFSSIHAAQSSYHLTRHNFWI